MGGGGDYKELNRTSVVIEYDIDPTDLTNITLFCRVIPILFDGVYTYWFGKYQTSLIVNVQVYILNVFVFPARIIDSTLVLIAINMCKLHANDKRYNCSQLEMYKCLDQVVRYMGI